MITTNFKNWVLFAVLLTALLFSTLATAAPIKVELEVVTPTGGEPELKVKDNEKPCDGIIPSKSSCIIVQAGKTPNMVFELDTACSTATPYKLSGFRITLVNKSWPTPANPLNAIVTADFNADPYSGKIDFTAGKNKLKNKKIKFKNHNSRQYTVFYEITAKHCKDSDADDIQLDPEIRNKG